MGLSLGAGPRQSEVARAAVARHGRSTGSHADLDCLRPPAGRFDCDERATTTEFVRIDDQIRRTGSRREIVGTNDSDEELELNRSNGWCPSHLANQRPMREAGCGMLGKNASRRARSAFNNVDVAAVTEHTTSEPLAATLFGSMFHPEPRITKTPIGDPYNRC
jgi:hypothetical protein